MFDFFSSREERQSTVLTQSVCAPLQIDDEKAKLAAALHTLLESLPLSYNGQLNIKRLCETILDATPHLRHVWIGFCDENADQVAPYAALGDCTPECSDWRLPQACFDYAGPYSQASQESIGAIDDLNSLFAPWQQNMEACSVNCALAIPLRADKPELRGLLVFYADDIDYFSHLGVGPFQSLSHVAEIIWQQSNLLQMLTQKTQLDALTGLMNRRKTVHVVEKAIERANQTDESLSIMLCRIDDFNQMNELHGWLAADAILAAFAKKIAMRMRPQDKVGRWAGTEFLTILPRTDSKQAQWLAESLQAYFMSHSVVADECSVRLRVRVSVVAYSKESNGLEDLIQQASRNLVSEPGSGFESGLQS